MTPNRMLPSDVARVALRLYEGLGTPIARSLAEMLEKGEWDRISDVNPDPRSYSHPAPYFLDAAAAGLLRKCQGLPTTVDRRRAALDKWYQGERDCYETNERLSPYLRENVLFHSWEGTPEGRIREFLSLVRKKIVSWIGHAPPELAHGRFGPGATYSKKGGRTTVPDKMSSTPSLTRGAIWFLPQWLGTQWGSAIAAHHGEVTFVPGNRFATVPKTAKTDRAIAAEPDINVFYQLSLGRVLRRRLRKTTGWDLDVAQEVHGQVARTSSVTREFATLDLSNASDTVAKNLVKILLPPAWYEQLDGLRSPKTLIDGKWVVLEKFSSMGNGFTFELETIIFAAIACAVSELQLGDGTLGKNVFVFGDDIIVKNDAYRSLKPVLEFLGFSLNVEKSFFDDVPFRESCGQDYFDGKPVRPYFLKEFPNGPEDYIAFANGLRALGDRLTENGLDGHHRAWFSVLDRIPVGIRRCRGPKALGDIVIHDDKERWSTRWRRSIRYLQAYRPHRMRVVKFDRFQPEVILACATYGTGNRQGGVIPREGVLSHKVGWVAWS
jgi:hypothetical protein